MDNQATTNRWAGKVAAVLAMALFLGGPGSADVRNTKHNLAKEASSQGEGADGDGGGVCVSCHPPTGIEDETTGKIPLWQGSLGKPGAFPIYDDLGRVGRGFSIAVGSQSIACLSCHDSVQAFAVTNLTYDHPFGVPYRGLLKGGTGGAVPVGIAGNPFKTAEHVIGNEGFRPASSGIIESRRVWWVPSGPSSPFRGKDDLPLYTRTDSLGQELAYLECSSCHDPHTENREFLRVANQGSRLCLTCHEK